MIVELARSIQEKQFQKGQLDIAALARNDIEATRTALMRLQKAFVGLAQSYSLLRDRLPPTFAALLREQLSDIAKEVHKSSLNFEENSRQVTALDKISDRIAKLASSIRDSWAAHATALMRPYTELLALVGSLPEIVAQEESLRLLLSRLTDLSAMLPQSASQIAAFDNDLHQLSAQLAELENLAPEVKSFLRKVVDGQATVADLSPEVLAWCQDHSHASTFTISFRQRRGASS
jgi:hypothetical protein